MIHPGIKRGNMTAKKRKAMLRYGLFSITPLFDLKLAENELNE